MNCGHLQLELFGLLVVDINMQGVLNSQCSVLLLNDVESLRQEVELELVALLLEFDLLDFDTLCNAEFEKVFFLLALELVLQIYDLHLQFFTFHLVLFLQSDFQFLAVDHEFLLEVVVRTRQLRDFGLVGD